VFCIGTCDDGLLSPDNGETDVDCGGKNCPGCANDAVCDLDDDCQQGLCIPNQMGYAGNCVAPTPAPTLQPTTGM
jgi:hypothetical protein